MSSSLLTRLSTSAMLWNRCVEIRSGCDTESAAAFCAGLLRSVCGTAVLHDHLVRIAQRCHRRTRRRRLGGRFGRRQVRVVVVARGERVEDVSAMLAACCSVALYGRFMERLPQMPASLLRRYRASATM